MPAMILAAQAVEVVGTHRDWVDYAAAAAGLAGVAGALAALVALKLAKQSADDAASSLEIMRNGAAYQHAERARHAAPEIILTASAIGTSPDSPPATVLLRLGFRNDGDARCEGLTVNFLVPARLDLGIFDENGNRLYGEGPGGILPTDEALEGRAGAPTIGSRTSIVSTRTKRFTVCITLGSLNHLPTHTHSRPCWCTKISHTAN